MKKFTLITAFVALSVFLYSHKAFAATYESELPFALQSRSAVVMNASSGQFVQTYNPDVVMPIASLTKLMTAMVFLDVNPGWNKRVTYRTSDNRIGAKLYIYAGDTLTVRDLFNTMLIGSANNATIALVRSSGLTTTQFVARMNAKATALGLSDTYFVEPTGLDAGNVSTAHDYALLAQKALSNATIEQTTRTRAYSFRTGRRILHTIKNSDTLLKTSALTIRGGKTGYTEEAGYSMALKTQVGVKKPVQYITVVLGNPNSSGRFAEARELATFAATL